MLKGGLKMLKKHSGVEVIILVAALGAVLGLFGDNFVPASMAGLALLFGICARLVSLLPTPLLKKENELVGKVRELEDRTDGKHEVSEGLKENALLKSLQEGLCVMLIAIAFAMAIISLVVGILAIAS